MWRTYGVLALDAYVEGVGVVRVGSDIGCQREGRGCTALAHTYEVVQDRVSSGETAGS